MNKYQALVEALKEEHKVIMECAGDIYKISPRSAAEERATLIVTALIALEDKHE